MKIGRINCHFNKITLLTLILFLFLLFYPKSIEIAGLSILNEFVKTRVLSLGILFLALRGIIDDYYSPKLALLFLLMLILSPTLSFGQLILATLSGLLIFRLLKMI